jgi:hypothetical protein
MEYAITVAFLLAVVAGSFAAVILGGYGVGHLIASALDLRPNPGERLSVWNRSNTRSSWSASTVLPTT